MQGCKVIINQFAFRLDCMSVCLHEHVYTSMLKYVNILRNQEHLSSVVNHYDVFLLLVIGLVLPCFYIVNCWKLLYLRFPYFDFVEHHSFNKFRMSTQKLGS